MFFIPVHFSIEFTYNNTWRTFWFVRSLVTRHLIRRWSTENKSTHKNRNQFITESLCTPFLRQAIHLHTYCKHRRISRTLSLATQILEKIWKEVKSKVESWERSLTSTCIVSSSFLHPRINSHLKENSKTLTYNFSFLIVWTSDLDVNLICLWHF